MSKGLNVTMTDNFIFKNNLKFVYDQIMSKEIKIHRALSNIFLLHYSSSFTRFIVFINWINFIKKTILFPLYLGCSF